MQDDTGDTERPSMHEVYKYEVVNPCEYKFYSAMTPQIWYSGRFLRHPKHQTTRKTKLNTVQFDWSGCTIGICVKRTSSIAIRLKGSGNYFNVFIDKKFKCIIKATLKAACCILADDLTLDEPHHIEITKRTEPQMRGAMSTFKVCTFYGFTVDAGAEVLDFKRQPKYKFEFIGDSQTCAFGNEGAISSSRNFLKMKGRMQNIHNGFAQIVTRMFDAESHIMAWSGKGVHSNSLDWGASMSSLWKRCLAAREGEWDLSTWVPDATFVFLGCSDVLPPSSQENEVIHAFTQLIEDIRTYRPRAHIFCIVCDEGSICGEDSNISRQRVALQLQEIVKVAMSNVKKHDQHLHYTQIKILGALKSSDFGNMMHYSVTGHTKLAEALAEEIQNKTGWSPTASATTMAYPPSKKDILIPVSDPRLIHSNCKIS